MELSYNPALCVVCMGLVHTSCALCADARCYSSAKSKPEAKENLYAPLKLPGELGTMTGTVMYPDDKSEVWDVNSKRHAITRSCIVDTHIPTQACAQ